VGLALNPAAVEGQLEGSVVQGLGGDYGPDGHLRNASLLLACTLLLLSAMVPGSYADNRAGISSRPSQSGQESEQSPPARKQAVIAANRFGLGARPGELPRVDRDPKRWLLEQLDAGTPQQIRDLATARDVLGELQDQVREVRAARQAGDAEAAQAAQRSNRMIFRDHYIEQATARYEGGGRPPTRRFTSARTSGRTTSPCRPTASAARARRHAREGAIKPHVAGRFSIC
jgi:hypothetical protein